MTYDDFEFLTFDLADNGVMLMTLNRPQSMNSTTLRGHWELVQVWDVLQNDPNVKVIVVTGAGDRAFSAGGDIELLEAMVGNPDETNRVKKEASDIVYNVLACEKPIISAINGVAVGAGLAVALMADISLMVEDARLTDGHVKLGVGAGDHAAIIWPILCGMAKAKYYLMTAEFISGAEAERIGLVTFATPRDELMPRAMAIADKLADGSQTAISATKMSLNNWMQMAGPIFDNSLALEMMGFLGADAKEGLAAMKEKRAPVFPSAQTPSR